MAITLKEKELAAVGISVATGCKPCTDFHIRKARKTDASDVEIKEAISDALFVRRNAADIMEAYGLAHLGRTNLASNPETASTTDRMHELVCIGAAFGVNCVSNLKAHLDAAEKAEISHEEIMMIVKLSSFIKGKAASHVDRLAESLKKPEAVYEAELNACCHMGEAKGMHSHNRNGGGMARMMMSQMMKECCGEDGRPNFEKMKGFMEKCGKQEFTEDHINMMHHFCEQKEKPDAKEMQQLMEKCGC